MSIRPATPDDLDALVALAGALFREDAGTRDASVDIGWPARDGGPYYAALIGDARALVIVAEAPAIVGFLTGRVRPHDPLRPDVVNAELESMYVLADARTRGVGRALVDHFHAWTEQRGATRTTVTAHAANGTALRFYRALEYHDHTVTLERPADRRCGR